MSSQHSVKEKIRQNAESLASLLVDVGYKSMSEELTDLISTARYFERELSALRTSEAFSLSAEAHRNLEFRARMARKAMYEGANNAIRVGDGAVYFAGQKLTPEQADSFANRLHSCANEARQYNERGRKLTMIGVAKQATDRVIPVQIVTVN